MAQRPAEFPDPTHGRVSAMRTKWRQAYRLYRREGAVATSARALAPVARRITMRNTNLGVRVEDLLAADLVVPRVGSAVSFRGDRPLTINWVTTPPSLGSGGHTTTFRIVRSLRERGHRCRIYLYDVYGGAAVEREPLIRSHYLAPGDTSEVANALDGMDDADAVFATSWPTAYPAFNDPCAGKRFYLVQDFEPMFFPAGAQAMFAENTYRMGFHAVTAGRWLAEKLAREYSMAADSFDFGCDVEHYGLLGDRPRDGVAFYARRETPRRAFELGVLALELFSKARPDMRIHLYGERVGRLPFAFTDHGVVSPRELNVIYNGCFAGLSLSMTNVSLVPYEMLAAGCVPVVNDAEHNRVVLDNPFVHYAPPDPPALARALLDVAGDPEFHASVAKRAASVGNASWDDAGGRVEAVLLRELSGEPADER